MSFKAVDEKEGGGNTFERVVARVWDPTYSECGNWFGAIGEQQNKGGALFVYEEIKNCPRYWKGFLSD